VQMDQNLFLKIIEWYRLEVNITLELQKIGVPQTSEILDLIYDLQAGTYTKFANEEKGFLTAFTSEISQHLKPFLDPRSSILDCGIGEATSTRLICDQLNLSSEILGIDSSWSRLSFAQANTSGYANFRFAVANIMKIPLKDNSVDCAITIHAIEPNFGKELQMISEMSRVSQNLVVSIEPEFETASTKQQDRMSRLGYARNIRSSAKSVGLQLLKVHSMSQNSNALNRATIFIWQKISNTQGRRDRMNSIKWVDPSTKATLRRFDTGLISSEGLFYPKLKDIPFLRTCDAKFALSPSS
jgi:ubiquinone/menaquinone biosynthesis C-methylase UbiE